MGNKEPEVYESLIETPSTILLMCKLLAEARSKDPKTKVGCCVYDQSTGSMHFGYNGLPRRMYDRKDIWDEKGYVEANNLTKHDVVIHAEMNAITKALAAGADMEECILICTLKPCLECGKLIAASGIRLIGWESDNDGSEISKDKLVIAMNLSGINVVAINTSYEVKLIKKEET